MGKLEDVYYDSQAARFHSLRTDFAEFRKLPARWGWAFFHIMDITEGSRKELWEQQPRSFGTLS